jgi:hypothetical protein
MGFSTQERINLLFKTIAASVVDANSVAQWYESRFPYESTLDAKKVWLEMDLIKQYPASSLAVADGYATTDLSGVIERFITTAIHLTPVPGTNNTTLVALDGYNDFASMRLDNWISPVYISQSSGAPSNGYSVRLYQGDPNNGGTEIFTTLGQTGVGEASSVGWFFNYSMGLLFLSNDLVSVINPLDLWITGFRYIGRTALDTTITIQDEGTNVSNEVNIINFVGANVKAMPGGVKKVNVYIPPPVFESHWNTNDGTYGARLVTESITRTSARVSSPISEGTPFKTGGWAGTAQPCSNASIVTFTTPGATTGFGGDSNFVVQVYDADGTTLLDGYTTPPQVADGYVISPSNNIKVTISGFAADSLRYKATASVEVKIGNILTSLGRTGGRYKVKITHNVDTVSDGSGSFVYTQSDVFYDTNPTTPSIGSTVTIAETVGSIITKHISGLEYYTTGSQFTVNVNDIDQLNKNTAKANSNLTITGTEYGLATLSQSPFGTGSSSFTGWDDGYNTDNVNYAKTDWAISTANYRFIGTTANISSNPSDTWGNGSTINSANASVLIDTYTTASTGLFEDFNGETRRQDSGFNTGTTVGNWNSSISLSNNEALVQSGQLMAISGASYTNWSSFKPNLNGANPDYSGLTTLPANYYRTFFQSGLNNIVNFTMVFSGTFAGGNALADLTSGALQIFVYKIGGLGYTGAPPTNSYPLQLHGTGYNNASFDDGYTDGRIRTGSSSGNTIQATFGGFNANDGFFCHVVINNATIKIDSISVTLNAT